MKTLFHFLSCGYLKTRSNIIISHEIINKTITARPSNDNTPWSTEQLISTFVTYKDRVAANLLQTFRIFERVLTSGILVISLHKHLLSNRKRDKDWYLKEIEKIHPSVKLETGFLFPILKYSKDLRRHVIRNRSKTGKR